MYRAVVLSGFIYGSMDAWLPTQQQKKKKKKKTSTP